MLTVSVNGREADTDFVRGMNIDDDYRETKPLILLPVMTVYHHGTTCDNGIIKQLRHLCGQSGWLPQRWAIKTQSIVLEATWNAC